MRGELNFARVSATQMEHQIKKLKEMSLNCAKESHVTSSEAREINNKILALKNKSEEDK